MAVVPWYPWELRTCYTGDSEVVPVIGCLGAFLHRVLLYRVPLQPAQRGTLLSHLGHPSSLSPPSRRQPHLHHLSPLTPLTSAHHPHQQRTQCDVSGKHSDQNVYYCECGTPGNRLIVCFSILIACLDFLNRFRGHNKKWGEQQVRRTKIVVEFFGLFKIISIFETHACIGVLTSCC